MIILLDSNILGLVCNDNDSFDEAKQCQDWFYASFARGARLITSDLCNYEVLRGLISSEIGSGKVVPGIKALASFEGRWISRVFTCLNGSFRFSGKSLGESI